MPTDIEIAQSTALESVYDIARRAGIDEKYLEPYGRYKAKVDLKLLSENPAPDGKLILVTAMTPRARPQRRSVWRTDCGASAKTPSWRCASRRSGRCSA